MAQAAEHNTPIEWSLDDVFDYLTGTLGYSISRALHEMWQQISTRQLLVQVEEYDAFSGLQSIGVLDPVDKTLKLGRNGRVQVVPRVGPVFGNFRYCYIVFEQDVLTLWPPHPPASQTAADQQQDERLDRPVSSTRMAALPLSHEPTAPSEKPKETSESRLINVMKEIGLEKSGLLPREVYTKVRPQFIKKYPGRDVPAHSTFNRAYKRYINAKDTSAE